MGIGTTSPTRKLEISNDYAGLSIETNFGSPYASALRFGDNTGWKLLFGRSRESVNGVLNSGPSGALMTIQDNGNVGIGTVSPKGKIDVYKTTTSDSDASIAID